MGPVQKIGKGDYLQCYLTGVSRLVGILEVQSNKPSKDHNNLENESFPYRLKVKPVFQLDIETAVPVKDMKDILSAFKIADSSPLRGREGFAVRQLNGAKPTARLSSRRLRACRACRTFDRYGAGRNLHPQRRESLCRESLSFPHFSKCNVHHAPSDLPDGEYLLVFEGGMIPFQRCGGVWHALGS